MSMFFVVSGWGERRNGPKERQFSSTCARRRGRKVPRRTLQNETTRRPAVGLFGQIMAVFVGCRRLAGGPAWLHRDEFFAPRWTHEDGQFVRRTPGEKYKSIRNLLHAYNPSALPYSSRSAVMPLHSTTRQDVRID
jgi:hypothetical protein